MVLATLHTDSTVEAVDLTPEAFAPFGSVISTRHQLATRDVISANYGTAQKIFKIVPVINNYASTGLPASTNLNMFRCSPPNHLLIYNHNDVAGRTLYPARVLERHPYSTQTFLPMGRDKNETAYIVIVAATRPDGLPDLDQIHAFLAKGDQAVTYGPGTWHAPMVALVRPTDFGVLIHENGVPDDDCQETYLEPGVNVTFDLDLKPRL